MKLLNLVIQPFLYFWFFTLLTILLVPISILALPFSRTVRTNLTTPFWNLLFKIQLKTIFFANIYKEDHRDETNKSTISPSGLYISNHQSFSDIPLIFSTVTIPPIMKKEVIYIPIFGICAYSAGGILVDRKNKDSRKQVFEESKQRLSSGKQQLLYFPEGTRQKNSETPKEFKEIKKALIQFAYENNIPVYPISIHGTSQVFNNGKIQPFKKLGIILHKAHLPNNYQTDDEFIKSCWNSVIEGKLKLVREINP